LSHRHTPNGAPGGQPPSNRPVVVGLRPEHLPAEGAIDADTEAITEAGEGVARVDPSAPVKPGERVAFTINVGGMQFFDPSSGEAIWAA